MNNHHRRPFEQISNETRKEVDGYYIDYRVPGLIQLLFLGNSNFGGLHDSNHILAPVIDPWM